MEHTQSLEVFVFCHEDEAAALRVLPNHCVGGATEPCGKYIARPWKHVGEKPRQAARQLLVEEEFHARTIASDAPTTRQACWRRDVRGRQQTPGKPGCPRDAV